MAFTTQQKEDLARAAGILDRVQEEVTFRAAMRCSTCKGQGLVLKVLASPTPTCPDCKGSGQITASHADRMLVGALLNILESILNPNDDAEEMEEHDHAEDPDAPKGGR